MSQVLLFTRMLISDLGIIIQGYSTQQYFFKNTFFQKNVKQFNNVYVSIHKCSWSFHFFPPPFSLIIIAPLSFSPSLKNTCPDHWNQALPEIWTISERSPPPTLWRDFHRCCHILLLSYIFLSISDSSALIMWSIFENPCLPFFKIHLFALLCLIKKIIAREGLSLSRVLISSFLFFF